MYLTKWNLDMRLNWTYIISHPIYISSFFYIVYGFYTLFGFVWFLYIVLVLLRDCSVIIFNLEIYS